MSDNSVSRDPVRQTAVRQNAVRHKPGAHSDAVPTATGVLPDRHRRPAVPTPRRAEQVSPPAGGDTARATCGPRPTRLLVEALRDGLAALLETDPRVHVLGEDVADPYGGAFKVTRGLSTRFPGRVRSTPISEGALVGVGLGMALRGLRPIVELMFGDFVTLAVDQLVNEAAKARAMFGRAVPVPLVVRTPMGGRRGYGPTHSQTLEGLVLGTPYLDVFALSPLHEPADVLAMAVASERPTLLVEHKLLYGTRLPAGRGPADVLDVATSDDPLEPATVAPPGPPDVTVAVYGGAALVALEAARRLAVEEEIRLEVVVPTNLAVDDVVRADGPLRNSLSRTGRLVVVDEAPRGAGWADRLLAALVEGAFPQLRCAPRRVTAMPTVLPAARHLEDAVLPGADDVSRAALETLGLA